MRLALALWTLHCATAEAEPRVVLLVDTSASMAWSSCGDVEVVDGSEECEGVDVECADCPAAGCGDGQDNDSRLTAMKAAITQFVDACEGTRFGLARFHQEAVPFACPSGGWLGTHVACRDANFDPDPGEGYNRADVLVDLRTGDPSALRTWIDGSGNQDGTPAEKGCDLCEDCGGGCDQELRASGGTAVAGSLRTVRKYLTERVIPEDEGAKYSVFLFSDGLDNCPGDAVAEAEATCEAGIGVQTVGFAGQCPLACDDPCFSDCDGSTCPQACADTLGSPTEDCVRDCDPSCLAACHLHAIARAGCGPDCRGTGCSAEPLRVADGAALAAALEQHCPSARGSDSGCGCSLGGAPPGEWCWLLAVLALVRATIGCRPVRRSWTSRAC